MVGELAPGELSQPGFRGAVERGFTGLQRGHGVPDRTRADFAPGQMGREARYPGCCGKVPPFGISGECGVEKARAPVRGSLTDLPVGQYARAHG